MDLHDRLAKQKCALAKATEKLHYFYETHFVSEKLQILKPLLKWEATLMTASTIDSSLVPLFLGFKQLFSGEENPKNPLKLIGPHLKGLIDAFTKNLTHLLWQPQISDSNAHFFKEFISFSFLISTALGCLISKKEKAPLSEKKTEIHHLSYHISLLILANSTLVSRIYTIFLKSCDADERSQQRIAEILSFVSWLLMIFVASEHNPQDAHRLIETVKNPAIKNLESMEQALGEIDALPSHLLLFIQKCKKYFEEESLSGIIESIEGVIEGGGSSLDNLKEEFRRLYKVTEFLEGTLNHGLDDKTNKVTAIAVVV